MRKRLRKKRHVGEFREYCFEVSATLVPELSDTEFHRFVDRFIDVIEGRCLQMGGGGTRAGWSCVVAGVGRRSPTEQDREWIKEWLSSDPAVASVDIGDFRDAWHGW